ncbi:MAG: sigma 54-interacting transcriptional regulator [Nitrospirae bacterium]|nr:sigma 54-interacting transcriptional regulator [Nitrospirota bacterium]
MGWRETLEDKDRRPLLWLGVPAVLGTLLAFVALVVLYRSPYSGFHTALSPVVTSVDPESPAGRAGFQRGDTIVSVNGKDVHGIVELFLIRRTLKAGREVTFTVEHSGVHIERPLTLQPYGRLGPALLGFVTGLVFLVAGFVALWKKPQARVAQLLALTGCALIPALTVLQEWVQLMPYSWLIQLWMGPVLFLPPVSLHLSLSYPRERTGLKKRPWLVYLIYLPGVMFFFHVLLRSMSVYRDFRVGESVLDAAYFSDIFQSAIVYATVSIGYFAVEPFIVLHAYRSASDRREKLWIGLLFLAGLLTTVLGIPMFVSALGRLEDLFSGLVRLDSVLGGILLLGVAWLLGVMEPSMAFSREGFRKGILYGAVAIVLAILAYVSVALIEPWLPSNMAWRTAAYSADVLLLTLAGLWLKGFLDERFLEGESQDRLSALQPGPTAATAPDGGVPAVERGEDLLKWPKPAIALVGPRPSEAWLKKVSPWFKVDSFATLEERDDSPRSRYDMTVVERSDGSAVPEAPNAFVLPSLSELSPQAFVSAVIKHSAGKYAADIDDRYTFVTCNPKLKEISEFVKTRVSQVESPVLVTGESGSGKELAARLIHKFSRRSKQAFVAVNCSALAPGVLESELFGHEKGAFTGALQRRLGKFESAHLGTLFLDEIGDLRPEIQVKLLRVLQDRVIERVGGNESIPIDVRIVAATNRDLKSLIASGAFREDLFYRLNGIPVHMPPLRERKEDIPWLVSFILEEFNMRYNRHVWMPEVREMIRYQNHTWSGNIRELENWISRNASAVSDGEPLPFSTGAQAAATKDIPLAPYDDAVRDLTVSLMVKALRTAKGNVKEASRIIGMEYNKMRREIRRYEIDVEKVSGDNG